MNSWCGCCRRTFQNLQQRLLDTFARDVTRDRRILALPGDLVDLVDVDNACLGTLDVKVGCLDQLEQNVLDVLADVARFGERRRISDRKRHVQLAGKCLREVGLAATGRAKQQNVRFGQFDFVASADRGGLALILNAPVVVVDGHGEDLLGLDLTDDVIIEESSNLTRIRQVVEAELSRFGEFLFDDLVAEIDALVADVDARARNELLDLLLRLAAKRTLQQFACVTEFGHCCYPSTSNEFVVLHSARPSWPGARHCAPPADSSRGYRREPEVSGSGRPGPPSHATRSLCR